MAPPSIYLSRELVELLTASGREWRVENGGKHAKLFISSRMVAALPRRRHDSSQAAERNLLACVRRALRSPPSGGGA